MNNSTNQLVADSVRKNLSQSSKIGAGNFLDYAIDVSPNPNLPILFLEKQLRGPVNETFEQLSLNDLSVLRHIFAARYIALGVERQDLVGVYLNDGIEYLIHYLALTYIGAVPVLINGNMSPDIAMLHADRVGCKGLFLDEAHLKLIENLRKYISFDFITSERELTNRDLQLDLDFKSYTHALDDPIMIAHSSGTTGVPKAVLLEHEKFFYGVRQRLRVPKVKGGERILSSLPHSHNCAISYIMLALLSGTPVYIASDHRGFSVLRRIEEYQPSMVVSFPQTYVEMVDAGLDTTNLKSVKLWFNGGDAAHETHIRKLISNGSVFIDGMGSSEMGFSLFKNIHSRSTNRYDRCVGQPLAWVDAAILSDHGKTLAPGQVGRLGVKAASVTSGYWNDSNLTYKSRMRGYFLTGDLAYRDAAGFYYHVDRVSDVIETAKGPIYSLLTEEIIMSHFDEVLDCSVFGDQINGAVMPSAVAYIKLRKNTVVAEKKLLKQINKTLHTKGCQAIAALKLVQTKDIPLGTTGKVLKRQLREFTDAPNQFDRFQAGPV